MHAADSLSSQSAALALQLSSPYSLHQPSLPRQTIALLPHLHEALVQYLPAADLLSLAQAHPCVSHAALYLLWIRVARFPDLFRLLPRAVAMSTPNNEIVSIIQTLCILFLSANNLS